MEECVPPTPSQPIELLFHSVILIYESAENPITQPGDLPRAPRIEVQGSGHGQAIQVFNRLEQVICVETIKRCLARRTTTEVTDVSH